MIRKFFCIALLAAAASATAAYGQAVPAVIRGGNIEAGGSVGYVNPDYGPNKMGSIGAVVDLNGRQWFGLEAEGTFAVINGFNSEKEFMFDAGPRIFWARHRWIPYGKFLIGFNHLTFPQPPVPSSEGGTNFEYVGGGGLDWRWTRKITLRGDVSYHIAPGFGDPNDIHRRAGSLTPLVASGGVKWRF